MNFRKIATIAISSGLIALSSCTVNSNGGSSPESSVKSVGKESVNLLSNLPENANDLCVELLGEPEEFLSIHAPDAVVKNSEFTEYDDGSWVDYLDNDEEANTTFLGCNIVTGEEASIGVAVIYTDSSDTSVVMSDYLRQAQDNASVDGWEEFRKDNAYVNIQWYDNDVNVENAKKTIKVVAEALTG